DCSKFLNCANGRFALQSCSPGTLFNPSIGGCDWPNNVVCTQGTERDEDQYKENTTPTPTSTTTETSIRSALFNVWDSAVNKADWTVTRTKDKGKRFLNKIGVSDSQTLCRSPTGQFAYPKDCSKFVNCWGGRPYLQNCAPGTLFNIDSQMCDWPSRVVCVKDKADKVDPSTIAYVEPPVSGQKLRLRSGNGHWEGRVEVFVDGKWQVVTDDPGGWTITDGHAVCRQLGYHRGCESVNQGRLRASGRTAGLRQVICSGTEKNIEECQLIYGTQDNVAKTLVGVNCAENWVSECGPGGISWGDKCYHVFPKESLSYPDASKSCKVKGGRLVSIVSQEENDFVSDLLEDKGGSAEGFHTGGIRTSVFGDVFWLWQGYRNGVIQLPLANLNFVNWWPGWKNSITRNAAEEYLSPISSSMASHCIVLRDTFPLNADSQDQRSRAPTDYFFWQLSDCNKKFAYICEMDKKDIGCIHGNGANYEGGADVTANGLACLNWSDPKLVSKVKHFSLPQSNHCSNPDGDDQPWCFVKDGVQDFCDIPRCVDATTESKDETENFIEFPDSCPADHFTCDCGDCILQEYLCDEQIDCSDQSDEKNCPDYSSEFTKLAGHQLTGNEVEKWLHTEKKACSRRCAESKKFVCMSFNYEESSKTCILSSSNDGASGGLVQTAGWEYHELNALKTDCTNKFTCQDGKCISPDMLCDGRKSCAKGEDENDCKSKVKFEIRLVNGSEPHEGRVEVKAFGIWGPICDDMWGEEEGDVVCQELGYELGAKEIHTDARFGAGNGKYIMDDLNCHGNESSLQDCSFDGWANHDCSPIEAAGVICHREGDDCGPNQWRCINGRCITVNYLCDGIDDCKDESDEDRENCKIPLEVRLSNSETYERSGDTAMGRVEVRYLGVWGSICDDDISFEEGNVLCRMMGWNRSVSIFKNNTFGKGEGPVWLDDLQCVGTERTIEECLHLPWGQNNCDHTENLGLQCTAQGIPEEEESISEGTSVSPINVSTLPPTCGYRSVTDTPKTPPLERPKVVSGYTPTPGAHPWMVGIRVRKTSGSQHWCGAAILGEDHILTAAHCVSRHSRTAYILRVGDFDTITDENEEEEFHIEHIFIHPEFDKIRYMDNDIAVVKIKRKRGKGLSFSKMVQPICLPDHQWSYPSYMNCTVAGWGSLGNTLGFSRVLQAAVLPLLPHSTCSSSPVYGPRRLGPGMYCAGYLEGGVDTCQGDSGGPMVCDINGRLTAVGITSWGHGCARPNKPGVYTKVSNYLDWMYSVLS
ncbi:unnamed protein product, partial [Meganyctiphanes norvegica]